MEIKIGARYVTMRSTLSLQRGPSLAVVLFPVFSGSVSSILASVPAAAGAVAAVPVEVCDGADCAAVFATAGAAPCAADEAAVAATVAAAGAEYVGDDGVNPVAVAAATEGDDGACGTAAPVP
jgi:hypothetical protein